MQCSSMLKHFIFSGSAISRIYSVSKIKSCIYPANVTVCPLQTKAGCIYRLISEFAEIIIEFYLAAYPFTDELSAAFQQQLSENIAPL